jgi:hypothetical protein
MSKTNTDKSRTGRYLEKNQNATPAPASQLPPSKKRRTAFRKRACARVSKVREKGEGGWNKCPGQNIT